MGLWMDGTVSAEDQKILASPYISFHPMPGYEDDEETGCMTKRESAAWARRSACGNSSALIGSRIAAVARRDSGRGQSGRRQRLSDESRTGAARCGVA